MYDFACRLWGVVFWLQSQRAPMQMETGLCTFAAAAGSLEISAWLHSHNCPWDKNASTMAFIHGHLEILSWLAQQGCSPPRPDLQVVFPAGNSTWAEDCCARIAPAQKLLGQNLSNRSAQALRSCYRDKADLPPRAFGAASGSEISCSC